jgi:hypothetical protein
MDMIDSILLDMCRAPAGSLVAAPSPNDEFADDAELRAGFDDHGFGGLDRRTMASPRGAVRRFTKFRGQRKVMRASRVWCQPFPAVRQIIIYNLECLKARV